MSMSILGKYKIAVDTAVLANGDSIASYLVDGAGNLLTSTLLAGKQRLDIQSSAEYAEDSVHASGDYGAAILAVRHDANTSMVDADGDYGNLQLDATGRLKVAADLVSSAEYAEDSAAVSGDIGNFMLAVRNDAFASTTSADGDYSGINVDAAGRVGIRGSYAEDAAHVSGDVGVFSMGVRNDTNAVLTSADGDYSPLAVDSAGRLKVVASLSGQYAEDSAHVSGDLGLFSLAVRRDADTSFVNADGDYAPFAVDALGRMKVLQRANVANLQTRVTVATTATLLPGTALTNRQSLMIQNVSNVSIFIGSATVTTSGATQGVEIPKGGFLEVDAGPDNLHYGIVASGTANVIVWEHS